MPGTRRTFLVGLGRFAMGAAALAIVKPPVLYSFPSEIRIASPAEQLGVLLGDPVAQSVTVTSVEQGFVEYAVKYQLSIAAGSWFTWSQDFRIKEK